MVTGKNIYLVFRRASYSKDSTPAHLREYRVHTLNGEPLPRSYGAVGTKKEIRQWARKKKIPLKNIKFSEEKERI